MRVYIQDNDLIAGLWALPAYTLKGVQMSSRNHKYRHEFNGIFGKRFVVGLHEYHKSTESEREEVLRLWRDKGFQSQVEERGDLKDGVFLCPLQQCNMETPHKHHVDGDADIHGILSHATV